MFALGCALNWLASDLEGADDVVVRLSAGGPDQIMVWDWSRKRLARRFPDLQVIALHLQASPDGTGGGPLPAGTVSYCLRRKSGTLDMPARRDHLVDLPTPSNDDLMAVLYDRRREMIRHHGVLITREAQRRAFELAIILGGPRNARLCCACDLLDGAILAYRQSLLVLARTNHQTIRIARAFAGIALAIERATQRQAQPESGGTGQAVHGLLHAIKDFQSVIGSLGGPPQAASVGPGFIDRYFSFVV